MNTGECCNRDVVVVGREVGSRVAAGLMLRCHVGDLVVVDEHEGLKR